MQEISCNKTQLMKQKTMKRIVLALIIGLLLPSTLFAQLADDIAITRVSHSYDQMNYSAIPLNQVQPLELKAVIENVGTNPQVNIRLAVVVTNLGNMQEVYNDTTPTNQLNLNPGQHDTLTMVSSFNLPVQLAHYRIDFFVWQNQNDMAPINNQVTHEVSVTQNVYASDNNCYHSSFWNGDNGQGSSIPYEVGKRFTLKDTSKISGVIYHLAPGTEDTAVIHHSVYRDIGNGWQLYLTTAGTATEHLVLASDIGRLRINPFSNVNWGATSLPPGDYLVTVGHYGGSRSAFIGCDALVPDTGEVWYLDGLTNQWRDTLLNPIIRLVLDTIPLDTIPPIDCYSADAHVVGNLYYDANMNCVKEMGEAVFPATYVKIEGTQYTVYATTDNVGNYSAAVDVGLYDVSYVSNGAYWDVSQCTQSPQNIFLPNIGDTAVVDFPIASDILCPELHVDIATSLLRRCDLATYYIYYSNMGTTEANNATVQIEFDPFITIDSSSIPWNLPQTGNVYEFDLGTLLPFNAGFFKVYGTLSCDTNLVSAGQTHCAVAHIYPDSSCLPLDPNWDGASIEVDARCSNDTVYFTIENVGTGNMSAPLEYYVTEDNVMLYNNTYQLNSGQMLQWHEVSTGGTYRLEAQQSPGHPWNDWPESVVVEGCGPGLNPGYVIILPESDYEPYWSIFCRSNTAAYDPNVKEVFPAGYDAPHYIEATNELEYFIRFQNTGTDTAFTVIITDTLSPYLNPATVVPGASSHNYTFELLGQGILKWTFDNILLPDSAANPLESIGFLKFKVQQQPNNPVGTVIENEANIYFDINAPVITNTAFNTIGEDFIIISIDELTEDAINITAYPNPATNQVTFTLSEEVEQLQFRLFNLLGKEVAWSQRLHTNKVIVNRKDLPSGIYLFELSDGTHKIGSGKIILH